MSPHNYTRYSWPLAIAALVIIAVSGIAPWLFTQSGCIDFTDTGEIGDTIGGTMSPFVGIAGGLMTFVAFMMQVRANEIQREQLGKSFNLKEMESKIEDRRAMELLKIDIDNTIHDIEERCSLIEQFVRTVNENPYDIITLDHPPFASLYRYQTINRNRIFNAFKLFFDDKAEESLRLTYSCLDLYLENVEYIYNQLDNKLYKEVEDCKIELFKAFKNIMEKAKDERYRYDTELTELFKLFYNRCHDIIVYGELDVNLLIRIINDNTFSELYRNSLYFGYCQLRELLVLMKSKNENRAKTLNDASENFKSGKCLGLLKVKSKDLETALNEHTEECITKEFEGNI